MSGAGSIPILMYHSLDNSGSVVSVAPAAFAEQMTILSDAGLTGISLKQAVDHRKAHGEWPAQSVVLTFDDGFANLHEHAAGTLKEHGFGATVFLVSGHMGGKNDWAPPPPGMGEQRVLSWAQAREMADAGIEMAAHTRTHPDLRTLSAERIEGELVSSRREIEDELGRGVETFAYPYGYLNQAAAKAALKLFSGACTTELRMASDEALNRLPRIDMYYFREGERFSRLLAGGERGYLTVRRCGRMIRQALLSS